MEVNGGMVLSRKNELVTSTGACWPARVGWSLVRRSSCGRCNNRPEKVITFDKFLFGKVTLTSFPKAGRTTTTSTFTWQVGGSGGED